MTTDDSNDDIRNLQTSISTEQKKEKEKKKSF